MLPKVNAALSSLEPRTMGADYLMLYDDKGRETLSGSRYTLPSYGTGEDSTTYDFRRLISGCARHRPREL